MNARPEPYLSVVAASRNDTHGGDPLRRTQIFVNAFLDQCRLHKLPGELIIVDWNPPQDRPGLATALKFDRVNEYGSARVISVPPDIHLRITHGEKLALFQMIAKNVGIRRARGKFILVTNIDILFSNELMALIAKQNLRGDYMYRVDRCDVDNQIPAEAPLEEQLRFCSTHLIRAHVRGRTLMGEQLKEYSLAGNGSLEPQVADQGALDRKKLHSNGCGDFTLLSREKWQELRGYPELEVFSFHLDTLLCGLAHYAGAVEAVLPPPAVAYHIEHSIGSGWSPEGQKTLFERIDKAGIPCLCLVEVFRWIQAADASERPLQFNDEHWGLAHFRELPDACSAIGTRLEADPARPVDKVVSIFPGFAESVKGLEHFRREILRLEMDVDQLWQGVCEHQKLRAALETELEKHRLEEARRLSGPLGVVRKAVRRWRRSYQKRLGKT
jgi:hypothetical protein